MSDLIWRVLHGLIQRLGWGIFSKLVLLFAITMTATYGIGSVLRDIRPISLVPFVVAALLATWGLHVLRFPGWSAGLILIGGGGLGVFIWIGRLSIPIQNLLLALVKMRPIYAEVSGWWLDTRQLFDAWSTLVSSVNGLMVRLMTWGGGLSGVRVAFDPLAAAMVWSLCAWALVAWMGWWVLRRQTVIVGLVPLIGLLAWVQYYTHAQIHLLILAFALSYTLHILTLHWKHVDRWQATRLVIPDTSLTLFLVITFVVSGLSLSALALSSVSLERIEEVLSKWFQPQEPILSIDESVGDALGLQVRPQDNDLFRNARQPSLPSQHLLTGGPELSENVFMLINLEGYPGVSIDVSPGEAEPPPRYYWRSLAYNRYISSGWYSDDTILRAYSAGTLVNETEGKQISLKPSERLVRQQVQIFRPDGGVVFYTGELLTVDQDYEVAWRRPLDSADALGVIVQGNSYQVNSRYQEASAQMLRQAGSDYPDWVLAGYLSLPETLPQRVKDQALDLTAAQPSPFDRALALETYLRTTYPYTLDLPKPPINRDLVDYFLFDLQRGYCDYYASAMVVMARAAGLPARLATGYVGGAWDSQSGRITVTEADAHSWVEIYFPEYGWIIFEPTSARPVLERLEQPVPEPQIPEDLQIVNSRLNIRDWINQIKLDLGEVYVWLLLAAGIFIYLFTNLDSWLLRWRSPQQTVALVYQRIYLQAGHLGVIPGPGVTLREFTKQLTQFIQQLAFTGLWQYDLKRLAEDVNRISELYEQALFSQNMLGRNDQRHCIQAWRRMYARFWLARLRYRFRQVVNPPA